MFIIRYEYRLTNILNYIYSIYIEINLYLPVTLNMHGNEKI